MAADCELTEKELLYGYQQSKQLVDTQKKDQRWLYYLIAGSFGLIIILNYMFPHLYWVENRPLYDLKKGFIGLTLMFFGIIILLNILCIFNGSLQAWIFLIIICIVLIYFGLPLLTGFS
jgi:uncharacterized protein YacL